MPPILGMVRSVETAAARCPSPCSVRHPDTERFEYSFGFSWWFAPAAVTGSLRFDGCESWQCPCQLAEATPLSLTSASFRPEKFSGPTNFVGTLFRANRMPEVLSQNRTVFTGDSLICRVDAISFREEGALPAPLANLTRTRPARRWQAAIAGTRMQRVRRVRQPGIGLGWATGP
jgi:hypothetical protein